MHLLHRSARLVFLPALFVLIATVYAFSQPTLPPFFSDNMVLQQKADATIWGWTKPGGSVQITPSWDRKKYTAKANASGKWKTKIATPAAGGPYTITVSDGRPVTIENVLIGEVWLCSGQSNMEMPMKGYRDQPILGSNDAIFNAANDKIRVYTVPRSVQRDPQDTSKESEWHVASPESIANFSAAGYFFGRLLQQHLKVPVGLICSSYGGSPVEAFMNRESLESFSSITLPDPNSTKKLSNRTPTALYNGMIHPLIGYTIKGCIWYQGEGNNGRPDEYQELFPSMVQLWRDEWGQGDFPFYYAQIAPYNYARSPSDTRRIKDNSAYLRDAQRKALDVIPNSGMVVLMDKGEEFSIHPPDKETVGKRFAYLALGDAYEQEGFAWQSPAFDSLLINGNTVTIKFKHAPNGLTSYGKPLTQFEIAGSDKMFRPAHAVISKGAVILSSPEVPNPVAVRYAFKDFVVGELFSVEGYPVSSFRTDNW